MCAVAEDDCCLGRQGGGQQVEREDVDGERVGGVFAEQVAGERGSLVRPPDPHARRSRRQYRHLGQARPSTAASTAPSSRVGRNPPMETPGRSGQRRRARMRPEAVEQLVQSSPCSDVISSAAMAAAAGSRIRRTRRNSCTDAARWKSTTKRSAVSNPAGSRLVTYVPSPWRMSRRWRQAAQVGRHRRPPAPGNHGSVASGDLHRLGRKFPGLR